jgi:hypothetical protein
LLFSKHSDWFLGPPTLPVQWVLRFFPWVMMLTMCLHLELRLRMSGAIPLLPNMHSWYGEGQLHLFYLLCDKTFVSTCNSVKVFSVGCLSIPAHTVVFVLNWKTLECLHMCKHGGCNCSFSILCHPRKFWQNSYQWWY